MIHTIFFVVAVGYVAYSALHISDRPGLFSGFALNSYIFQIYFGSIGPVVGLVGLLIATSHLVRTDNRPIQPPETALLLWLAFSLLSTVASWHIENTFYYAASLILLSTSNYLYGRAFGNHERFIPDLILSSCLAVAICEPGIVATRSIAFARLSGDLTPVGASLMADVPIVGCMSLLLLKRDLSKRAFLGISAFLVFVMFPISLTLGTRSVFLGAGVAFLVLLVLRLRQGQIGKLLAGFTAIACMIAIVAIVAIQFFPEIGNGVAVRAAGRLVSNFATGGGIVADTSSLERLQFWREAKDLILASPIYGYSLGAFSYLADNAASMYPHNMFLEILVNTGIIGLVLFLVGFVPVWVRLCVTTLVERGDWSFAFMLAALVDITVRMQVSLTVTQGKLLFLICGITIARTSSPGSILSPSRPRP